MSGNWSTLWVYELLTRYRGLTIATDESQILKFPSFTLPTPEMLVVQSAAIYARVSTPEQDLQRQLDECREHITAKFPDVTIVDTYGDVVSGIKVDGGEQYHQLNSAIKSGEYDLVVVHELSRLSRLGAGKIRRFVQRCIERETAIESLEIGLSIYPNDPPLQRTIYTMIASIMGDLGRIEYEQNLQRIRSGIQAAQRAGRWTGRPPRGFEIDEDGMLRVVATEYLEVREALLSIKYGAPKAIVAKQSGIPRSTLVRLFRDEQRRAIYLAGTAVDERIGRALNAFWSSLEARSNRAEDHLR